MSDDDNKNKQPVPAQVLPDDVLESLRSLIQGKADGDDYKAAQLLYNDNKQLRDKVRSLEEEAGRLREHVPEGDARVLSKEEVAQLNEIGIVGDEGDLQFTPLREKLETAQAAERELKGLKYRESLRSVAEAEGADFEALAGLAQGETFGVDTREVDGEEVTYGTVTYEDDSGEEQTVALRAYDRLRPYHNSLFQSQAEEETSPRQRFGVPPQHSGGGSRKPRNPGADFMRGKYSRRQNA